MELAHRWGVLATVGFIGCGGRTDLTGHRSGTGVPASSAMYAAADDAGVSDAMIEATSGSQDAMPGSDGFACASECTANQTRCLANSVQTCRPQMSGCTQWVTTSTCGTNRSCASGADGASCACNASVCVTAGKACLDGQTLAECTQDTSGCLVVESARTCAAPASCSGMAPASTCSLACRDSCTQGQTSCMSGSLATCTLGSNGCWAYGPPAVCGTHQRCTVGADSASCECNRDPVCNYVGTPCTSESAYAECAQDLQGCLYETSSALCSASTPECLKGACVACTPATKRCTGNSVQTCDSDGAWGIASACGASTTCVLGECTGVCGPGQARCTGITTPQTCDATGQWQSNSVCSGSSPVCVGGTCTARPPSCQADGDGLTNCGAARESCCTSPQVAAETYYRTYTNDGTGATGLADPANVSTFRLDKYDVTVGRFRQFVAAWNSGWQPPAGSGKHNHLNGGLGIENGGTPGTYETGWVTTDTSKIAPTNANLACGDTNLDPQFAATWTTTPGVQETLPINCVNWWESFAFCIWDGGFLPSEAEWECAAAGGNQQREYPWGTTAPGGANGDAIYSCFFPPTVGVPFCTGLANIAPVGTATLGAGLWGELDLVGEVSQWTMDWYAPTYPNPCTDCAELTTASSRVARGAYFSWVQPGLLPPYRNDGIPMVDNATGSFFVGIRCARTP